MSRLEPLEQRLAAFAREILTRVWEGEEADGDGVQDLAEKLGLITPTAYDPARHGPNVGDGHAMPGEEIFEIAADLKAVPKVQP